MSYEKAIIIVVKGGMVQDVYFERPFKVNAVIIDLDCDEGEQTSVWEVSPYDAMEDRVKDLVRITHD